MSLADPPLRLLIADDEMVVARRVAERVREQGLTALPPAVDGDEAWQRYLAERPDAMVMDMFMRGRTGLDVVRRVRALDDAGRQVLLVLMSSSNEPALRSESLAAGADHYLVKGTELDRLDGILSAFVARRSSVA